MASFVSTAATVVPPRANAAFLTHRHSPRQHHAVSALPRQRASLDVPAATSSPRSPRQPYVKQQQLEVIQPPQSAASQSPSSPAAASPPSHLGALAACAAVILSTTLALQQPALALESAPPSSTEAVFARTCAGCHAGGGNLLKPGAGLSLADLERNGLSTAEDIARVTALGIGRMPGYGEECKPRGQCTFGPRLSSDVIRQLADYTLAQAQAGWR